MMPASPDSDRYRGPCPVHQAVGAVGGKWAVPVVGRLARSSVRFGRLRSQLADAEGRSVSSKVLAAELARLVEAEIVERHTRGAAVSYGLTDKGRALVPLLDALGSWADEAG